MRLSVLCLLVSVALSAASFDGVNALPMAAGNTKTTKKASKSPKTSKTTVKGTGTKPGKSCTLGGKPMSDPYMFISQTKTSYTYAVCDNGVATCFTSQSGKNAAAPKKTTCPKTLPKKPKNSATTGGAGTKTGEKKPTKATKKAAKKTATKTSAAGSKKATKKRALRLDETSGHSQ